MVDYFDLLNKSLPQVARIVGMQREGWNVSRVMTETDVAMEVIAMMKDRPVEDLVFEVLDYTVVRPGSYLVSSRKAVDVAVMKAENQAFKDRKMAARLLKQSQSSAGSQAEKDRKAASAGRGRRGAGRGPGRGVGRGPGRGVGRGAGVGEGGHDFAASPSAQRELRARHVLGAAHPTESEVDVVSTASDDTAAGGLCDSDLDILELAAQDAASRQRIALRGPRQPRPAQPAAAAEVRRVQNPADVKRAEVKLLSLDYKAARS